MAKVKSCLKIQWMKTHTIDGKPVCPDCHEPAEMVIGIIGEPVWAHARKT